MFGTNGLDHSSVEGEVEGKEGTWLDSQVYSSGIGRVLLPRLCASAPQAGITENTRGLACYPWLEENTAHESYWATLPVLVLP